MARINGNVSQRSDSYSFYIEWSESNIDTPSNASKVSATAYIYCFNHTAYGSSYPQKLVIDGTEFTNTLSINLSSGVTVALVSGSKTITHDSDGSKSITISADCDLPDGGGWGPAWGSASGTAVLTKIPRASSITAVDANIESATTININRASSSFTHTIKYDFEGLSGTIATKTSDTSIGFQIPESFYAKIPNSKTGTVTLTCTTYSGDTVIGTSTTTFTVTANEAKCKPDISAILIDSNETTTVLTGDNSKLIKYKSTAKITPTATAKNSATIKSIVVNGYAVSGNYISFENTQSETFTVVATDSRGYTNTLELKPTIVQYIPLSITVKFDRLSATSSEVKVKYSGNYYNGNFGSIDNELTIRWAYKIKEASEWIDGGSLTPTIENNTFSGETSLGKIFNYKTAYDFILYVSDKLSTVNPQETVKKGETIFDYGIDADGNNYFNVNGEFYKKNEKLIQTNIITYAKNTNQEIVAEERVVIQLNKIIAQTGNKLSVSNYGVKIGKDVSKVKVSGIAWLESGSGYRLLFIMKNNVNCIGMAIIPPSIQDWGSPSIPVCLESVKEGDIISLVTTLSTGGYCKAGVYGPESTYLTVEVVE